MSLGTSIILKYDSFDSVASAFINNSQFLNNSALNYLLFFAASESKKVDIHLYNSSIFNCQSRDQVTKLQANYL